MSTDLTHPFPLAVLWDNQSLGLARVGRDGRISAANATLIELAGPAIVDADLTKLLPDLDRTLDLATVRTTLRLNHLDIEFRFVADGHGWVVVASMLDAIPRRLRRLTVGRATLLAERRELSRENSALTEMAFEDPLTGVGNRRRLDDALTIHLADQRRRDLCVVLVDLDHFKRLNDSCGHLAGDAVLTAVGALLTRLVRATDAVVRYGGEEFIAILPHSDLTGATRWAETARERLSALDVPGVPMRVTASLGVTEAVITDSALDLLGRVDSALYAAKRAGRNCVRVVVPSLSDARPLSTRQLRRVTDQQRTTGRSSTTPQDVAGQMRRG